MVGMLCKALDAFARLDAVAAAEVIRDDATIDEAFRGVMRQPITYMMEDPRTLSTAFEIVWVARARARLPRSPSSERAAAQPNPASAGRSHT